MTFDTARTFFVSIFSAFLSTSLSAGLNRAKIPLEETGRGCKKIPGSQSADVAFTVVLVTERCGDRFPCGTGNAAHIEVTGEEEELWEEVHFPIHSKTEKQTEIY